MTCGSCGTHNPPGARYCTGCGAALAEPTPIAAVAAAAANGAMARAARTQAANAAQADPAAPLLQAANQASADPAWRERPPLGEVPEGPAPPAYDAAPPRRGIAMMLLALCVIAAVAVVTLWQFAREPAPADTVAGHEASADGTPSVATPPTPAAPPADAAPPPVTAESAVPANATADRNAATSQAATSGEPGQPVEITQLPARPAPPRTARRPAAEKTAPSVAATPAPAASPAPSPPTVARAPATVPSVAPVADRWSKMNDELARCTREDFIARVICGQRVRFRYCEGYWGKVEACPASPAPERGQ